MTRKGLVGVALFCGAAVACTALVTIAGPINPPAGAVAPTLKTLVEVEPRIAINAANTPGDADSLFRITQPGSYYLLDDIGGVAGKSGIEIAASDVTLDLGGFSLVGVPSSLDGVVVVVGGPSDIDVHNGSVRQWGDDGIDLQTAGAINCRVALIRATDNSGRGIAVAASTSLDSCVTGANVLDGVSAQNVCTFTACIARANTGAGFSVGTDNVLTDCASILNSAEGFIIFGGCTLSRCTASQNTHEGIQASSGCTISGCSAVSNVEQGIVVGTGSTVTACSVLSNLSSGISAQLGSTIVDCSVSLNNIDGIVVQSGCLVRANNCTSNGNPGNGAAIHATGTDNRIEANNCSGVGHDRGIDVDVAGNVIVRNTVSGAVNNWDVVAGNIILVVNATTAPLVTGTAGGAAPGSTDPSANFSY